MINKAMTLKERRAAYAKRPKRTFLWNGVKEKSFGLVFGPAKSGKTIFCENLAMNLAMGSDEFFGYPLSGVPRKVLFVGLEEFWEDSTDRNIKQFSSLTDNQRDLVDVNYLNQPIEFENMIVTRENWENLEDVIKNSQAEVVFIDSITRMCPGKMENGDTASKVMQNLRNICHNLQITLICIHHTPKMYDCHMGLNNIKGSSVFQQELDFAIGINRTSKGHRYQKNVAFRYASDNNELVKEFEIDESIWLNPIDDITEDDILIRKDRRRNDDKRQKIINYLNSKSDMTYRTSDLVNYFKSNLSIAERQIKTYLSDLVVSGKIASSAHGYYNSIEYNKKEENEGAGI